MNTQSMSFFIQASQIDLSSYYRLLYSSVEEVQSNKAGTGKSHHLQLSKSEGDDLLFKTTPKMIF